MSHRRSRSAEAAASAPKQRNDAGVDLVRLGGLADGLGKSPLTRFRIYDRDGKSGLLKSGLLKFRPPEVRPPEVRPS